MKTPLQHIVSLSFLAKPASIAHPCISAGPQREPQHISRHPSHHNQQDIYTTTSYSSSGFRSRDPSRIHTAYLRTGSCTYIVALAPHSYLNRTSIFRLFFTSIPALALPMVSGLCITIIIIIIIAIREARIKRLIRLTWRDG